MVFSYLLFVAARIAQSDGFISHVTNFSAVEPSVNTIIKLLTFLTFLAKERYLPLISLEFYMLEDKYL